MRKEIDYRYFSKQQIKAAQIMATMEEKITVEEIANMVGVDKRTIYRWKKDKKWAEMFNELCRQDMDEFLAEANKHLKKSIRSNSVKGLELYYKMQGMLIDRKEVTKDMSLEITTIEGKTNDQLRKEAIEMEKKLLGQVIEAEVLEDE